MSISPKISIITVCFNEAEAIRDTCESVCSQTFADFEWIVIDGRSTDGTLDVLAEYETQISCLVSEPDKGIYHAMNKGVACATGDYLLFLNAGDYFANGNSLMSAVPFLNRDIVYGDVLVASEKGAEVEQRLPDILSRHFLLKKMMPHQSTFIKRDLFDQYGDYDESFRIAGDYDLFVRFIFVHGASCVHIPHTLSVFKTNGISCSASARPLRKIENHEIRKKHFPWFAYGLKGLRMECRLRFGFLKKTKERVS